MRKVVLLAAALAVMLGAAASSATSASSETGVTARTVTIGGTFPLTGPASLYAPIPPAMKAYFSYINSRKGPDGKRGVYGRQIVFKYYDDGYNPANSVQLTRKLVEEDKVFAVVASLGTAVNEAIRPYLNAQKVPQLLVSTGASVFGDAKAVPVDGWLAAGLRLRVEDLRPGDRAQQPQREDRRPLPERRLRQGEPRGSQEGPGREGVQHRRRGGARGDGPGRARSGRQASCVRRDDPRDLHDAAVHDPDLRDRQRAQVVAGGHLHDAGLGNGHVPHARQDARAAVTSWTARTPCSTRRTRRTPPGTTTRR